MVRHRARRRVGEKLRADPPAKLVARDASGREANLGIFKFSHIEAYTRKLGQELALEAPGRVVMCQFCPKIPRWVGRCMEHLLAVLVFCSSGLPASALVCW